MSTGTKSYEPQIVTYPRIEVPTSSAPKLFGMSLFYDSYDLVQLLQGISLLAISEYAFLTGIAIGAAKPLLEYQFKNVVPKKGNYEINQQCFSELILKDQEVSEKISDFLAKNKDKKTKVPNNLSGVTTYAILSSSLILGALGLKEASPFTCYLLTGFLGLKSGFSLAQRTVQWYSSIPKIQKK